MCCWPCRFHLHRVLKPLNKLQSLFLVGSFAEQEKDFFASTDWQIDVKLNHSTWVASGFDLTCQTDATKRSWMAQIAHPPQELCPVRRQAMRCFVRSQESYL